MFDGLYFEYPKVFSFIVIYIACEAYCKIRPQSIYFPQVKRLTQETAPLSTLMWFLKWLGVVFLVLALMSPVRDETLVLEPEHTPDIVFVLQDNIAMQKAGFDTSDVSETQFDMMRTWIMRWIENNPYSSYGLVIATDESYIASPLSRSTKALQVVVSHLIVNGFDGAVDYKIALKQALHILEYAHSERKLVILIGDSNDVGIQSYIGNAHDVKYYNIVMSSEDSLDANKSNTGVDNYRVSTLEALNSVYQAIYTKEKMMIEKYDYTFKIYYYFYPLFLAFFSLLIYVYLRNRRGH